MKQERLRNQEAEIQKKDGKIHLLSSCSILLSPVYRSRLYGPVPDGYMAMTKWHFNILINGLLNGIAPTPASALKHYHARNFFYLKEEINVCFTVASCFLC